MEKPYHLVSLGECLVEFTQGPDGNYSPAFAGDALNTLFYASRMGLATGFISMLGDDLFTPMIRNGIAQEGIDGTLLGTLNGRRNGLYVIELDSAGEYTFHFWRKNSAATETLLHTSIDALAAYISTSQYFLITGVTLAVMKGPEKLRELLSTVHGNTQIVLDTNYRKSLWSAADDYRSRLEELMPFIDVFLPTRTDLEAAYPDENIAPLLHRLADAGPHTIAMKEGRNGCSLLGNDGLVHYPAPQATVIDTTGAGDAFNAGFIKGLIAGYIPEQCCALARQTATAALATRGALNHSFSYTNRGGVTDG